MNIMRQLEIIEGLEKLNLYQENNLEYYTPEEYGRQLLRNNRKPKNIRYTDKAELTSNRPDVFDQYGNYFYPTAPQRYWHNTACSGFSKPITISDR